MSDMRVLVSDEYLDKDYFLEDDLSINEEEDKSEKKIKVIKILFCVLCLLLIGELVVYKYVITPINPIDSAQPAKM